MTDLDIPPRFCIVNFDPGMIVLAMFCNQIAEACPALSAHVAWPVFRSLSFQHGFSKPGNVVELGLLKIAQRQLLRRSFGRRLYDHRLR